MVISILLLLVLFIAGLVNFYFYLPSKKVHAWFKSFLVKSPQEIVVTCTTPDKEEMSSSCDQTAELSKVFATFDKNGDGFITKKELRESLKNIRIIMTEKEVEDIVMKVDSNGDGLIDFEEFCLLYEDMVVQTGDSLGDGKEVTQGGDEGNLKEAFDVFDKDQDGLISVEELGSVLSSLGLKEGRKAEDCKEMIKKVDMDGDGMVNFDEFKRMMKSGACDKASKP